MWLYTPYTHLSHNQLYGILSIEWEQYCMNETVVSVVDITAEVVTSEECFLKVAPSQSGAICL